MHHVIGFPRHMALLRSSLFLPNIVFFSLQRSVIVGICWGNTEKCFCYVVTAVFLLLMLMGGDISYTSYTSAQEEDLPCSKVHRQKRSPTPVDMKRWFIKCEGAFPVKAADWGAEFRSCIT